MKNDLDLLSLSQKPNFPSRWSILLDELIPAFVKNRFSPQDSWKNKPFSQDDVVFFSKNALAYDPEVASDGHYHCSLISVAC